MTNEVKPLSRASLNKSILSVLGPGILYAAAAVGVSHLVQATRAGANYGLGLTLIVIFACIVKYPSLRFGSDYAAATGKSLISSYRHEGWMPFIIYAAAQLFSMVFVIAAVSLFTLGVLQASLGFSINNLLGVSLLLTVVVVLLLSGHYRLLERLTKYIVAIFTVLIFVAVALVAKDIDWSLTALAVPSMDPLTLMFVVALIGFMPTPPDGAVLQSLWTCARAEEQGQLPHPRDARLDFNVGYAISVVLGLCFILLGAGVMHTAGVEIEKSNFGFAKQLLALFTDTIGAWSFPLIATAALFVMLSTLFTVVDGMTRVVVAIGEESVPDKVAKLGRDRLYKVVIMLLCMAAVLVLATLLKSFATFMDMTAVLVFIISPILAILNHRAMWSERVPAEYQLGAFMKIWSLLGIVLLVALTTAYFYFRFLG